MNDDNYTELGRFLKNRIDQMGLSPEKASNKCGLHHKYLAYLITNGKTRDMTPSLRVAEKIIEGLNIDRDELFKLMIRQDATRAFKNFNTALRKKYKFTTFSFADLKLWWVTGKKTCRISVWHK